MRSTTVSAQRATGARLRLVLRVVIACVTALVGTMAIASPSHAADRAGNQGRGTGWTLTGIPGNANNDVWFGTHLFARAGGALVDAMCLDFARLGPRTAPAAEGDYQTYAWATGNLVADRQLTYFASVVGSGVTAAGLENDITARNLAAAATAATWGVGELVGFDSATAGGRTGVWGNAWLRGDASFLRPSANDPGADTATIAELFRQLRVGGGSLQFGLPTAAVSGGGQLAPGSAATALTVNVSVPGGGPVPLLPVRVESISNLTGLAVGQTFRADAAGNVGPIQVAVGGPRVAGSGQLQRWGRNRSAVPVAVEPRRGSPAAADQRGVPDLSSGWASGSKVVEQLAPCLRHPFRGSRWNDGCRPARNRR